MGDDINVNIIQYAPFSSFVLPTFWHKLADIKLDIDRLNDSARSIYGYYTNSDAINCCMEIEYTAFNKTFVPEKNSFTCHGVLHNKNTIEDFKGCDKSQLILKEGEKIWENIRNGNCLQNPSLLANFILLSFADLKCHNYYYWFAFPAPSEAIIYEQSSHKYIKDYFNVEQRQSIQTLYCSIPDINDKAFFVLEERNAQFILHRLRDIINPTEKENNFKNANLRNYYFCFSDPCQYENPGWILRTFIACLMHFCPSLKNQPFKILSLRQTKSENIDKSILFDAKMPEKFPNEDQLKWIGWEKNEKEKYGPRIALMANSMDPTKLAETSVNLNLKLMKWRLLPELDLDLISNTKCLLLGAGTLGCAVARNLMSWGVTTITFVDYGSVSYSNPIRQNLFTHFDSKNFRPKASTAAERLKEIHPGMETKGYSFYIPMPGHPVGDSLLEKTLESIATLEKLISEHDVIYLLTDSRESRWMPTMLGFYYEKIVMNAALGFDSYLVMRHGTRRATKSDIKLNDMVDGFKCIPGERLGCYFCNDITAPGNSMKDRTLDQQCTVTRPAVSNIAASLAVELMVSLLQHKQKEFAPAYISVSKNIKSSDTDGQPEGILGIIPHSIRGMLSTYQQILPATEKFAQCIACSEKIINEYKQRRNEFLLDVCNSSKYLEDLTGITEMMEASRILECENSDFDLSDTD